MKRWWISLAIWLGTGLLLWPLADLIQAQQWGHVPDWPSYLLGGLVVWVSVRDTFKKAYPPKVPTP